MHQRSRLYLAGLLTACCFQAAGAQPREGALRAYIGTYTSGSSEGIYVCELDLSNGKLTPTRLAATTADPSFLALHPNHHTLYAVNEISEFNGKKTGSVTAFSIDPESGRLRQLNQRESRGTIPCHLVVDATGRHLLLANYGSGSVASLPIAEDGQLGEATSFVQHEGSSVNPQRQTGPHAHAINLDAGNRFAFSPDLGLDKVLVYRFDARRGTLTPNDPPAARVAAGSGPRHFAIHPSAKFAYVINEMASTVTAFLLDATRGRLTELQTVSTLPAEYTGTSTTAEIAIHPSGRFLYGSNRGHDSLAIFAIDAETGKLTSLGQQSTGGKTPRNFAIDPTGQFILAANQDSDSIVVFRVNEKTGALTPTGQTLPTPSPVCIVLLRVAP